MKKIRSVAELDKIEAWFNKKHKKLSEQIKEIQNNFVEGPVCLTDEEFIEEGNKYLNLCKLSKTRSPFNYGEEEPREEEPRPFLKVKITYPEGWEYRVVTYKVNLLILSLVEKCYKLRKRLFTLTGRRPLIIDFEYLTPGISRPFILTFVENGKTCKKIFDGIELPFEKREIDYMTYYSRSMNPKQKFQAIGYEFKMKVKGLIGVPLIYPSGEMAYEKLED